PSAITAARFDTTIILAATEAVLSAVEASGQPGWPNVRPTSCRCPTSTLSSPCPTSSARWPWAIARSCIGCSLPSGSDLVFSYFWRPKAKDGQLELVALAFSGGAERDIPECGRTLRKLESLTAGHGF